VRYATIRMRLGVEDSISTFLTRSVPHVPGPPDSAPTAQRACPFNAQTSVASARNSPSQKAAAESRSLKE
jgi:hypothetical protein